MYIYVHMCIYIYIYIYVCAYNMYIAIGVLCYKLEKWYLSGNHLMSVTGITFVYIMGPFFLALFSFP